MLKKDVEKIVSKLKLINGKPLIDSIISIQEDAKKVIISLEADEDRTQQLRIEAQVRSALSLEGIKPNSVKFKFKSIQKAGRTVPISPPAQKVANKIIVVGSGKGGVGKSNVSVNIAVELGKRGNNVGLLDADIYGPSAGKMLGLDGRQKVQIIEEQINPIETHGIQSISFSYLLNSGQPVVWRGPMLGKALEQFLFDTNWKNLDYLIIDLPPGTGDTHLSLSQLISIDGAVVVTTPQHVAIQDAERAIAMFEQVKIPILGIIENMSEYTCIHCGKSTHIFSTGGGSQLAESKQSRLLGKIPFNQEIMQAAESGNPAVLFVEKAKNVFSEIVDNIIQILNN